MKMKAMICLKKKYFHDIGLSVLPKVALFLFVSGTGIDGVWNVRISMVFWGGWFALFLLFIIQYRKIRLYYVIGYFLIPYNGIIV